MSNIQVERTWIEHRINESREHVANWGKALVRTDLDAAEVAFLAGTFRASKANLKELEYQRQNLAWFI